MINWRGNIWKRSWLIDDFHSLLLHKIIMKTRKLNMALKGQNNKRKTTKCYVIINQKSYRDGETYGIPKLSKLSHFCLDFAESYSVIEQLRIL